MAMRLLPFLRNVTNVTKSSVARMSGGGHGHHRSPVEVAKAARVTINDLPVPSGSWKEYHNARNTKWNITLGAAVASLAVTVFAMKQSHVFYLHSSPELKSVQINPK